MGGKGNGVEVRAASIRLFFSFEGQRRRETLMLGGKPMAPTPANVRYAHRLALEIRQRIKHGTFSPVEYFPANGQGVGLTVGGQLDTWLAAQRVEHSTLAGYKSAAAFWEAAVGSKALRGLVKSDVQTALAKRPDLSGKTINNYVSVLRQALDLAVADNLIQENPAGDIPRAKHQKEPPDPFSADEGAAIIGRLRQSHPCQVANMVEFWMWTGLRTSEIFALKWANVDLRSGTVLISEAVVRGEHKDSTKTNVARTVRLNSMAKAALQRQRAFTQAAGAEVFQDPRYGTPWIDERAFRRSYWTPTLKLLGIRYRRPYNMRHSYATAMLMAGMTPAFCARQLGHSVEMFLRTYAKWIDGQRDDSEMARLEALIAPPAARKVP
ncbi:MAG: tyrosine-type recombinase/integrase [Betaproteobacteria bacterium]|nr:tyrosine-type recombinase/integrase [Betaproteobacteria bacterium]